MKIKRMFRFGILTLVTLVATLTAINQPPPASADQPPVNECPPGNLVAGKGCKWDLGFDDITSVKFGAYRVPGAEACYAGFEFSPYDYQSGMVGAPALSGNLRLGRMNALGDVVRSRSADIRHSGEYFTGRGRIDFSRAAQEGNGALIVLIGHSYRIGSAIPSAIPSDVYVYPNEDLLSYYLQLTAGTYDTIPQRARSPWFLMPSEVNDFSALVFECLENIRREKEHQSMQEELRAKKAAEQRAAVKASEDARAKAELQQIELEAAKEIQQKALETELFKTQGLRVQLELEKLIIAAWNKVVEIRLAGAQERAKITNTFMAEVEANKAAFVASVQAKVEELRRLQQINETLRAAISAHNQTILDELAVQQALEEKQKQAIQDLEVKPPETATPSVPSN